MASTTNTTATAAPNDSQDDDSLPASNQPPTSRRPRPHQSMIHSGYSPIQPRILLRPNIRHPPPPHLSISPPPPGGREAPLDTLRRMRGFISSSLYPRIAAALESKWGRVITIDVVRTLARQMREALEQNYGNAPLFGEWVEAELPECPLVEELRFKRVLVPLEEGEKEVMEMDG